ncbi:MAG: metal-dependent transcriptional regulator [Dehalococcoidia bacterium]|nr:metal-dependent transcriptional regulator [Dehalococcoidia bacterium]
MGSERVEEYLEAIFKRQAKETPVSTSALAEDLKVSLPAVTDMMKRLQDSGFIEYEPNKGVSLTGEGRQKAVSIVRRHRLWERFLTDILGLKWDKAHEEACRLEHATSPETEDRLASLIGDADTCPHGHPIPDKDGNVPEQGVRPLSDFKSRQKVCISAIAREDAVVLRKVEKLGLKPGSVVSIDSKGSGGSMKLKFGDRKLVVEGDIAEDLLATPFVGEEREVSAEEAVPISALRAGESAVVKSYAGGRGMLGRCLSMGFTPGSQVRMIENYRRGPILVSVCGSEVALGREIAGRIMVSRKRP